MQRSGLGRPRRRWRCEALNGRLACPYDYGHGVQMRSRELEQIGLSIQEIEENLDKLYNRVRGARWLRRARA